MAPSLKVFRTPIGFHDAYVAAPSQKAALGAWGADANLFARGLAERVTDPALMKEPLAKPGTVIKRARASTAEHFASLKTTDNQASSGKKAPARKPPPAPRPRPSRDALTQAEQALADAQADAKADLAVLEREQARIKAEIEKMRAAQAKQADRLQRRVDQERRRHDAALDRWRAS